MPHTHGTVNEVTRGSKAHQRRLMMTLTLTGTVFVAEIVGAIITGSLALLVDAGHMLTDMSVLIASTVTAVLMRRKPNSSRMKAAFLEVVNDALGSVAVIASAVVMMLTGWDGFDAIAGGLIALLMIPRAVKLLHNALKVLLEETPDGLNLDEVRTHLENIPHVVAVHDLHASTVSTGMPMLMAHVVVEPDMSMDQAANVLSQLQDCLREHFPVSIPHTTFQLEPQGYRSPSAEQLHS